MVDLQSSQNHSCDKKRYSSNVRFREWDQDKKRDESTMEQCLTHYGLNLDPDFCPNCQKNLQSDQDLLRKEIHALKYENGVLKSEIIQLKNQFQNFERIVSKYDALLDQNDPITIPKNSTDIGGLCDIFEIDKDTLMQNSSEFEDIGGLLSMYQDDGDDDSVTIIRKLRGGIRLDN
jgi:hypothetical protein